MFHAHLPKRRFSSEEKRRLADVFNQSLIQAFGISGDDVFLTLIPVPNENFSFGKGDSNLQGPGGAGE
ncbi:MAG: tautomerase family protein [Acetobacter sp.]|jgi:hypothetical protein|nr:tautomerase family protein [Acetobacter sp.]MCI1515871.1 tautomerase family protein [Acetobacter sp.]